MNKISKTSPSISHSARWSVSPVLQAQGSTLAEATIYAALARSFKVDTPSQPTMERMTGTDHLRTVCLIDQEPIGKTPRSNPITYIKAYDEIRGLFAQSPEARARRLTPAHFSFNTGKGRCPRCQGNGYEKLEMYFLADLYVLCGDCEGKRFQDKILQVHVQGYSIHDVLNLTVDQAIAFFATFCPKVLKGLQVLHQLGLGPSHAWTTSHHPFRRRNPEAENRPGIGQYPQTISR